MLLPQGLIDSPEITSYFRYEVRAHRAYTAFRGKTRPICPRCGPQTRYKQQGGPANRFAARSLTGDMARCIPFVAAVLAFRRRIAGPAAGGRTARTRVSGTTVSSLPDLSAGSYPGGRTASNALRDETDI